MGQESAIAHQLSVLLLMAVSLDKALCSFNILRIKMAVDVLETDGNLDAICGWLN